MKYIILLIITINTTVAFAQNKNEKAMLKVDGACNMCKTRIEKAVLNTKGVKWASWSIKTHELKLIFNAHKTSTNAIANQILDIGHDVEDKIATDVAYSKVHLCCKYREESVQEEN